MKEILTGILFVVWMIYTCISCVFEDNKITGKEITTILMTIFAVISISYVIIGAIKKERRE